MKRSITGTTYSTQTVASSTVVSGEKLKMPLSSAAYHVPGSMVPDTSQARVFSPGSTPASCRSWTPYDRTPAATRIRNAAGPGEEPAQVDRDRAAVQQPAEQDRGADAERGAEQRLPGGVAVAGDRLGGRPEEQRGLQPFAADGQDRDEHQAPPGAFGGAVDLAAQLAAERPGGAGHPEDHPGDQGDRDDGEAAADRLLRLEGQAARPVEQGESERERDEHGESDAEPDPRQQAAPVGLDQVRDEDADHEGGFESLAEADQVVGEHPPDATPSS